jgi:large subunit ribosomal protein L30
MAIAIIRLRGKLNIKPQIKDTLKFMRLNQVNHAVVLPQNETTLGMLQKAKDYVTWGEVDVETLTEAITSRGRLIGDKILTDEHISANTDFATIADMAAAIIEGKFQYKELAEVKPLLRLHPAIKGLEGIKRSVQNGGALGYRGAKINDLIRRML